MQGVSYSKPIPRRHEQVFSTEGRSSSKPGREPLYSIKASPQVRLRAIRDNTWPAPQKKFWTRTGHAMASERDQPATRVTVPEGKRYQDPRTQFKSPDRLGEKWDFCMIESQGIVTETFTTAWGMLINLSAMLCAFAARNTGL